MPADPRHAPVPADRCGDAEACPELLPDGAELDCELVVADPRPADVRGLFDAFLGPFGLPTGRDIVRPGIYLFTADGGGQTWLAVDYLVPGTYPPGRDVRLNAEVGRCAADAAGAREPALDRWVVQLDGPLPTWLQPVDDPEVPADA